MAGGIQKYGMTYTTLYEEEGVGREVARLFLYFRHNNYRMLELRHDGPFIRLFLFAEGFRYAKDVVEMEYRDDLGCEG